MKRKFKSVRLLVGISLFAVIGCGIETEQKFVPPKNASGAVPAPAAESNKSAVIESNKSPDKGESKATVDRAADKIQQQQIDIILEMADAIEAGAADFDLAEFRTRQADLYKQFQALNLPATEVVEVLQRHQADLDKANQRLTDASLARAKKLTDEATKHSE